MPTKLTDRYLNEIVSYGGIPTRRADMIANLQAMSGGDQSLVDRYLQGHELSARLAQGYQICSGAPKGHWWIRQPNGSCLESRNGRRRYFGSSKLATKALTKLLKENGT